MPSIPVLRRRRRTTPAERVLGLTSAAMRALPAVRTARTTYKVVRRAPLIAGVGVAGVVIARRIRGGDGGAEAPAPAPPASVTPTPATEGVSAGTPPHGDPLGHAAAGVNEAGDATATRHGEAPDVSGGGAPAGGGMVGAPDAGGPSAGVAPAEPGTPTIVPPDDAGGGAMVGAPDAAPADAGETPSSDALDVEGPNESAPGHHPAGDDDEQAR